MSRMLHLGDVEVDECQFVDLCRRYQVRELSLFGSAARGEMRPDSDIDLLVEFLPNAQVGLAGVYKIRQASVTVRRNPRFAGYPSF